MACRLTVVCGAAGSGKTSRLLKLCRVRLAENRPGSVLWLAPTWRAVSQVRGLLLGGDMDGCLAPGLTTFQKFAQAILQLAPEPIRPIGHISQRHLVRRLIDRQLRAGRIGHFRPIAETSGLVDLVCRWIRELKRLEIWPEHFRDACTARGLTDKDSELLELYEAYQQALREHGLFDAEGCFWSARDLLGRWLAVNDRRPALPPPWSGLRLVVADGFTDFTRTQHEILRLLTRTAEEVLISLPLEAETVREDLFAKPLKTLNELRRRNEVVVEQLARPRQPRWPAIAHLERHLFSDPRQTQPAEDAAGIEILAAAHRLGEVETIAARIKRLLAEGRARPGEIAVVLRSPAAYRDLVAEVFARLGIPMAQEGGQPLARAPSLRALVALLHLDAADWPGRELLAVLRSNYFQPAWPEWRSGATAATAERIIRSLQVPRGRQMLLDELERLAAQQRSEQPEDAGSPGGQAADKAPQAEPVLSVVRRLAAVLDELPECASLGGWAAAWQQLAERTGMYASLSVDCAVATGIRDADAWSAMIDALQETDRLHAALGENPPEVDRREALAALVDLLGSQTLSPRGDEAGRVRVLSAQSVRSLSVPYVFLAGLAEKAFPAPQREDRLYGEAEYERLIQEGLPLVARTERNREEMLLFYEVVTRPTRRLYLSYPAWDSSGQPLSPSPYLTEVEQAIGPGRVERTENEWAELSPVPPQPEPLSAEQFRLRAMAEALEGDAGLLAGMIRAEPSPGLADSVLAGVHLVHLREDRERFGPAEGILQGEAARKALAESFPASHVFSATVLERYASCPYQFFLERLLKIEPPVEVEPEADLLQRGWLAHEVLAQFHRRVNQTLGRPGSPLELEPSQFDRLLAEVHEAVCADRSSNPLQAALREVDRRILRQWLAGYREQLVAYEALWKDFDAPPLPERFEVSFGRAVPEDDGASVAEPLDFVGGDDPILLSGRIDRVDVGRAAGAVVFNVIDYKTGRSSKFSEEAVQRGTALQLPIYAIAASELILADRDCYPWMAGYWYVADKGFKPKASLAMYHEGERGPRLTDQWEHLRQKLSDVVRALVRGIREGEFPVYNEDDRCTGYCPLGTVCRINQVRSLEKTWRPAVQAERPDAS